MTAVVCQRTSVRVSAPDGIHLSRKGFDSRRICSDGFICQSGNGLRVSFDCDTLQIYAIISYICK